MKAVRSGVCLGVAISLFFVAQGASPQVAFKKNDRIAFIGDGLADRMQYDGWLEAYLQAANPGKNLVIRNMGFSGDQISQRPREEKFPSADEILGQVKADVIFVFFGYNESYSHDPEVFKKQIVDFIDETVNKQYNGKSAPRIVLFSPIAFENHHTPNLPDGVDGNLWLSIYTDAMARIAQEKRIPFVDLFAASKSLYEQAKTPLTINGVHLNADGNKSIAQVILKVLGLAENDKNIDAIRAAVQDKNWCWFNRYRPTDGNDVWGNRSILKFTDGITNAKVLQHELVMLDVMADNRDKVIWKAIQGKEIKADDSNVPKPVPVKTDFGPANKDGSLNYIPASQGVSTLQLSEGLKANLFASEEQFPEMVNPVQMDVDAKGRLWVAAWETYPKWEPDQEMKDRLLILPDENHDGIADKVITFAYVHNPTGFTFWNGGVIVASVPNFLFLKDTDGDDKADVREVIFSGLDSADTHHSANSFDYGPDGYIYYQRGIFNVSNVETPWQAAQLSVGRSGMYRFNPRTYRFSFHVDNSPNPHGGDFDYWGYHYTTDATSGRAFQVLMDGKGGYTAHEMLEKKVRPVPSSGILSSAHFPPEYNQNYIILNAIGFLGIKRYVLENHDGVMQGIEQKDLLVSSDPDFRPSDFKVGEDGALYVADWANAIIGHMQHNIRDPSRDHAHGRVYRITCDGRPLQQPVAIAGQPIETLLDVLKNPVDGIRLRARIELSGRDSKQVLEATAKWIQQFDPQKKEDAHNLLEALWLYQQHNVVNEGLLTLLLNSPEVNAQRAAQAVKYMWENEGQLGHMAHQMASSADATQDYMAQEKSPEPKMEGDTMVVHIQTLKEQMKYDRKAFAVGPGMKVKVVFTNPDAMDHNMVFVQPGAASHVAMAAMMLGADGVAKNWIPQTDKIIASSKLLSIGKTENIEFTAPAKLGDYDYICTYPGHFMLMNGIMHVVSDPQKWMAENKDIVQEPGRKTVKEWTEGDLASDLHRIEKGRSMEKGAEVFKVASCFVCHLPNKNGGRIGPDLLDVAKRFTPAAMLTEMIEPSKVINEKFKSWQLKIDTDDPLADNTVFGIIVEENNQFVRVLTNPLQDIDGVKIPKNKIKERKPAPLSTMPTGLLNSFTKEEILDLMAYVRANGPSKQ